MRWDDLNARVRGLSGRLLGRARIRALEPDAEPAGLARQLRGTWLDSAMPGALTGADLDHAIRRAAAQQYAVVARWAGPRVRRLRVLFEDEDRRSVRALVRGALAGARAEMRLAGLIPTPSLPERALEELAAQSSPAAIGALLLAWRQPFGSAVLAESERIQPDPFIIELAIDRTFAQRAVASAKRAGRVVRRFVAQAIDVENTRAAVVLATSVHDLAPVDVFLDGGRLIDQAAFIAAAESANATAALARLAEAWSSLGEVRTSSVDAFERSLLRVRLQAALRTARTRPLTAAPVFAWALRLRAEVLDLRTIVWARSLRVPAGSVRERLVSV